MEDRAVASTIDKARLLEELDAPFALTAEQVSFYAENGYIKLKHVLSPELLEHYRKVISERVAELSAGMPCLWNSARLMARRFCRS